MRNVNFTKAKKLLANDKIAASHKKKKQIVSEALYQKSQRKIMNFEKLLGQQVFKNLNYNPFQPCCVIYQYLLLLFFSRDTDPPTLVVDPWYLPIT